jgi:hypothetical protein
MPRSGQSNYRYEGEWETVSFEGASPASADARMAGSYAAMGGRYAKHVEGGRTSTCDGTGSHCRDMRCLTGHRELNRGVTQLLLNIYRANTLCEKDGGLGVSKTMRHEVQRKFGLLQQTLHRASYVCWIKRRACLCDKEPRRQFASNDQSARWGCGSERGDLPEGEIDQMPMR